MTGDVQLGEGTRFAIKGPECGRVRIHTSAWAFHDTQSMVVGILGKVGLAEPAPTDETLDLVSFLLTQSETVRQFIVWRDDKWL